MRVGGLETSERPPTAAGVALADRRRARELEARRRIRTADAWLLASVLGEVAFIIGAGAVAVLGADGRGMDASLGTLVLVLFAAWQSLAVYRLSLALSECRPVLRVGSMFLPFAGLSVFIAIHSKAARGLRRS